MAEQIPEQRPAAQTETAPATAQPATEKKPSWFQRQKGRLYGLKRLLIDVPLALFAPIYYLGLKAVEGIYHMYSKRYGEGLYNVGKGGAQLGLSYTNSLLGLLIPGVDAITSLYEIGSNKKQRW
jgi:hypothetical protein